MNLYLQAEKSFLQLINDILVISNSESRNITLDYGPISVHSLFKKLDQSFIKDINAKNNKLEFFISSSFPKTIFLDELRLLQILSNIIDNANNFTESGKIQVSCGIDSNQSMPLSNIHFSIQDEGIGIPFEEQKSVFDAFKQVNKGSNLKGVGLGLTLSKNLCTLMDGNITLESQENKGFPFYLEF